MVAFREIVLERVKFDPGGMSARHVERTLTSSVGLIEEALIRIF